MGCSTGAMARRSGCRCVDCCAVVFAVVVAVGGVLPAFAFGVDGGFGAVAVVGFEEGVGVELVLDELPQRGRGALQHLHRLRLLQGEMLPHPH